MKKVFPLFFLITLIFSGIFLIAGNITAQCNNTCQSCSGPADCCPGLTCDGGKCRGCQTGGPIGSIFLCNPLMACDFQELINIIINYIFWIAVVLAPLMILIAAFYLITAGGNPERVRTATRIIMYTLIGFAIILLAKGLVSLIINILGI